jgi:hypothetical protein
MIKEIIMLYNLLEEQTKELVDLFNDDLSRKCEHSVYCNENEADIFMNYRCGHPKGDGHCCIVACALFPENQKD